MMLANHHDRAGLRPLLPHLHRKPDLGTDFEILKTAVDDAIAMEIDIPSISAKNAAITIFRHECGDPAVWRHPMTFCIAPLAPGKLQQLPVHGIEGITNGDIGILVGLMLVRLQLHDQLLARNGDINIHLVEIPLLMVLMLQRDNDAATHDLIMDLIKGGRPFTNVGLHRCGWLHMTKGDL